MAADSKEAESMVVEVDLSGAEHPAFSAAKEKEEVAISYVALTISCCAGVV